MTLPPHPKPPRRKPVVPKGPPTNADIIARQQQMEETILNMEGMLTELYQTMMVPQPGQSHSLLNRMAKVTIDIESGERTSDRAVKMAQKLITLGSLGKTVGLWVAIAAAVVAFLKLGQWPPKE
jgi:hypothetical protein